MEAHPSRMLAVLRDCGALAALLPEVDALFGVPQPPAHHPEIDTGVHVALALDWAAAHDAHAARALCGARATILARRSRRRTALPRHIAHEQRSVRIAQRFSERLRVPQECRDVAALAARWHGVVHRAARAAAGDDARLFSCRSMRCAVRSASIRCVAACAADACSRPGAAQDYAPAALLRGALAAMKARGCRRDRARRSRQARASEQTRREDECDCERRYAHARRLRGAASDLAQRAQMRYATAFITLAAARIRSAPAAASRSRPLPAPSRRAALRRRASHRRSRGSSRRPRAGGRGAS